jgi:hypothetical protein
MIELSVFYPFTINNKSIIITANKVGIHREFLLHDRGLRLTRPPPLLLHVSFREVEKMELEFRARQGAECEFYNKVSFQNLPPICNRHHNHFDILFFFIKD